MVVVLIGVASSICTARRSAPWLSRCVAKAWRRVCGDGGTDIGLQRVLAHQMPEHGARHRFTGMGAAHGHEDRIGLMPCQRLRARMGQIALQPVVHRAEGRRPLLVPLPVMRRRAIIQASGRA